MSNILESIRKNPVIAAVRKETDLKTALESEALTVFILNGDIFNIKEMVDRVKESGKHVFIHVDFLEGLGRDNKAIDYIAGEVRPTGILSTKSSSIKHAMEKGIFSIQRFFLVDSLSYDTAVKTAAAVRPDVVEIMPAVMPSVIRRICGELPMPVIAGGLIETKEEIIEVLRAGCIAASTGKKELWSL
jgi:glycerol uptake operon antiterminator